MIWKRLEHPNIVPFLGITSTPPQLISEWVPNGDLIEYVKKHLSADRLRLVSAPAAVLDCLLLTPTPISYAMSLQVFNSSTPET